jgi:hypothetical protein
MIIFIFTILPASLSEQHFFSTAIDQQSGTDFGF